jgi:indole-3-glycerol phosphate synthase
MAETVLDRIVEAILDRQREVPAADDLEARARRLAEERFSRCPRSLRCALGCAGPSVIAECKHASPSAGVLRADFDPVALAESYQAAGAAAVSVVTEPGFFRGDPGWLPAVRARVSLPVLRKDFVVTERQLFETALAGADAVLLIQRILDADRLAALLELAAELHLEVLLEIFADDDPSVAVESGAGIIGVNARDLATFATDLGRVAAMAEVIPSDRVRVAESGIHGPEDLERLQAAGYDAFLIGERLVRSPNPGAALRELIGPPHG